MKVEESELLKWKFYAKQKNMHLSDVIKSLMRDEELPISIPVRKEAKRKYSNVDPLLLRELNAIGNNINQISTRINIGNRFNVLIHLREIELNLERVLDAHQIH